MMRGHACDACGGSGQYSDPGRCRPGRHRVVQASHGAFCGLCGCSLSLSGEPLSCAGCPVCLGAGSFPDQMPARDAVADAETLCRAGQSVYVDHLHYNQTERRAALPVLILDGGTRMPLFKTRPDRNRDRAVNTASAAFRAVPGLRA